MRVSKILSNVGDLQVDEELFENLPVNSDEPQFLASEVFRDTLMSFGVDEDTAGNARKLFLAIKKDKFEETQNAFYKVASELNCSDVNSSVNDVSSNWGSSMKPPTEFSFMQKNLSEKLSSNLGSSQSKEVVSTSKVKKGEFMFSLEELLPSDCGMTANEEAIAKQAERMGLKIQP